MNQIIPSRLSQLIYGSVFFAVLGGTVWLYWGGLYSVFLFDDLPNLGNLAGLDDTKNDISQFVSEGIAGPLGRPLSLLTFALQAHYWPFNPWPFKYVNLMIHLLNGCLIFWLIFSITRLMNLSERRCLSLALLTSALWLWHPLHVSTVLYVVQRMAQLSTLFTLAGLLVYLQGRQYLAEERVKSGFFLVSVGVVLGGLLATFSKENGVLLVLYIIVLEVTVLRALPKSRYWTIWSWIFLYSPLILLAFYFITHIDNLLGGYQIRDFTLGERLLTQTRILADYLSKILLLRSDGFGLFHDDYIISQNLLTPPTTLISTIFIFLMFIIAVKVRRTLPVLALGVFWFLAGHALESSFIGLMLYFEHRNYLAMLGIIFSLFYAAMRLFDYILSPYLRKIALFFAALWFAFFPVNTWLQTDLWSKPLKQTILWAKEHPHSQAAQIHALVFFQTIGENSEAEKYARHLVAIFPKHSSSYLYLVELSCSVEQIKWPDMQQIIQHLQTSKYDHVVPPLIEFILGRRAKGHCQLESETMEKIFNALIHNPNNIHYKAEFYYQYARFHAFEKRYGQAVQAGKQALALKDSPHLRLILIDWLISDHLFDEAMIVVQKFRTEMNPIKVHFYEKELNFFEKKIKLMQELHEMGFQINKVQ